MGEDPRLAARIGDLDMNTQPTHTAGPGGVALARAAGAAAVANLAAGNVSSVQKNLVSAAELALLDSLGGAGWLDEFARVVAVAAPNATAIAALNCAALPAAPTNFTFSTILHGGGILPTAGAWRYPVPGLIIPTPKTRSWAVAFDSIFPVPNTGGALMAFGIGGGSGEQCLIYSYYSQGNANAHTHLYQTSHNGGDGPLTFFSAVEDGTRRRIVMAFDTTTVSCYVNGVLSSASTDLSCMPTSTAAIIVYGQAAMPQNIARIAWATEAA
jgi:hypothetical protein